MIKDAVEDAKRNAQLNSRDKDLVDIHIRNCII